MDEEARMIFHSLTSFSQTQSLGKGCASIVGSLQQISDDHHETLYSDDPVPTTPGWLRTRPNSHTVHTKRWESCLLRRRGEELL